MINLGAITTNPRIIKRIDEIAKEFSFSYKIFSSVDDMNEESFQFFIINSNDKNNPLSGITQLVKHYSPDSFISILLPKRVDENESTFLKKSGASILLLEEDIFETSKIEYLAIQIIKTSQVIIKPSDLIVGTLIDFDVYHMMPSNKKYLKVVPSGRTLDQNKKNSLVKHSNELYIKREDLPKFAEYVGKYQDKSAAGIDSRCRTFYMTLQSYFLDLIVLLSDEGSSPSFSEGRELLSKTQSMCSQLLFCLASANSPWNVINNSIEGDFGSLERTPGQVATIGIISMNSGFDNIDDLMFATLINNLGLLKLSYSICRAVKEDKLEGLSKYDLEKYNNHPIMSINLVINKKLPLDERMKNIVLNSHFHKKGVVIPDESQLIRINEKLDNHCLVKMGSVRKDPKAELIKIIDTELDSLKDFSIIILQKLKKGAESFN